MLFNVFRFTTLATSGFLLGGITGGWEGKVISIMAGWWCVYGLVYLIPVAGYKYMKAHFFVVEAEEVVLVGGE